LTSPQQPSPQHPQPPPAPQADATALIPTILAVIALYIATKPALTAPWRAVAAAMKLPALAGGALEALARRALERQHHTTATLSVDIWAHIDDAVAAGVDAGMQGLVGILRAVEGRTIAVPKAILPKPTVLTQNLALAPTPQKPWKTGTAPIPTPPLIRMLRAEPTAVPDNTPPPTPLNPASIYATALDLVDLVINATTNRVARSAVWQKSWKTSRDQRVRLTHQALEGVTIGADESFQTLAGPIKYPHDPDAAIELVVNCRCWLEWAKGPRDEKTRSSFALAAAADAADGRRRAGTGDHAE
jgi:hypothetical protein